MTVVVCQIWSVVASDACLAKLSQTAVSAAAAATFNDSSAIAQPTHQPIIRINLAGADQVQTLAGFGKLLLSACH
jgi:hypothetical protein